MGVLGITGDLVGAGAAFSGLVLVFLGFAVSSFDSYDSTQKRSVRTRFQWRTWLAFSGLALSIASTAAALAAKAANLECLAWIAIVLLALAAALVIAAAVIVALDVR
jgi:hypothetical protein